MDNFPKKDGYKRIFGDSNEDLPSEVVIESEYHIHMIWKINGSIGRNNNLPARVKLDIYTFYIYPDGTKEPAYDTFELTQSWYKNSKAKEGPDPCEIITEYDDNVETNRNTKTWIVGKYKRKIITDDEKIVEEWKYYNSFKKYKLYGSDEGYLHRPKDLPARITTFKKTGKQRLEWYSTLDTVSYLGPTRDNDKPCVIEEDGTQIWSFDDEAGYINNIDDDNEIYEKYHHLFIGRKGDNPAIIKGDGTRMWYHKGVKHREDKPAVIYSDGTEMWYHNGLKHRDRYPAVIYPNGKQEWWTHGVRREERDILKSKLKNDDVVDKIMRML
jgi:hypothetical protein